MEMRRMLAILFFFVLSFVQEGKSQGPVYSVRNGKMFIQVPKDLPLNRLDSFIARFDLEHLALEKFIKTGFSDSLRKNGWEVAINSGAGFIITKQLESFSEINNAADRIIFTGNNPPLNSLFPSTSSSVKYGYNRFRNKGAFTVKDSFVTFFIRQNLDAKKVMLAGSFNGWNPEGLAMQKTDSGWIRKVKLKPGKYWYKFIRDGNWTTDVDNRLNENDGLGNVNSVYYVPNTLFHLGGYQTARKVVVAGSFNGWNEKELQLQKTENGWELPLYLADGTHTYRYIVDGKWITDPDNPDKLPNEFNDFNSVIRKGPSHLFKLNGYENATRVYLTGSFNNWRKDELLMNKVPGGWELKYVLGEGNYEYQFIVEGTPIPDPAIGADTKNNKTTSLVLKPNYTFRLKGFDNARQIYLAGDFNNWATGSLRMKKENEEWTVTVNLSPGKHLYKFIVDGKWIIDPANKLWEQNEHNTGNSVIWIE
jgi:hypothetical protein